MKAVITRQASGAKQTLGAFELFNEKGHSIFTCKTLELPWLNNANNVSCIPTGTYHVVPRKSRKHWNHFHVKDVSGRSWILIHSGNYYTDIEGCILVGKAHVDINGDGLKDVTSSRDALKELLRLAPNGFTLEIE